MSTRVWDQFLTESDRQSLKAAAPKVPYGFGDHIAVLSIDNYRGVIGDQPEDLVDALSEWPKSMGRAGWSALENIATLFASARSAGLPVLHVTGMAVEEAGILAWNISRGPIRTKFSDEGAQDRYNRRYDIVDQAAPMPGEVVLKKSAPSAFFGTPLLSQLILLGIDTLVVCGEAVSGCVRATVVDGRSYRFRMIVVEECVYDRHEATRAMNLFDIHQKYGDVISLAETLSWIESHADSGKPQ